jgi:hypothetical protein
VAIYHHFKRLVYVLYCPENLLKLRAPTVKTKLLLLRIFVTLVCAPLLFSCSKSSDQIADNVNPALNLNAALAMISEHNMQASVNYLAADAREGRMTGSPGYDEAAHYLVEQFTAIGLEPAGTDGWMQQVPFITATVDPENSGVTLHKGTGDVKLVWKENLIVHADRLRPQNRVRAEVVYVGFGVHAPELGYSDYEGIDVSGKIVAMFTGAPATFSSTERAHYASGRIKTAELARRGAVGDIELMSRLEEKRKPWKEYTRNLGTQPDMSWIGTNGEIADFHTQVLGSAMFNRDAAERLFEAKPLAFEQALDAAEQARPSSVALGIEVTMYRKTEHMRITSPNVVGLVRGSDPHLANEYVVYSTHLDHLGIGAPVEGDSIYNGMYDNALGVAMITEIARALAAMPVPPRRSIVFLAVTGEEQDLLGSDYFAHYPTVPSSAIVANVNIDMPLMIAPLASAVAYGAEHSSLEGITVTEAKKEGFDLAPDEYPEEVYFIRSDQYSFVRQGIPAVYFAEGPDSPDPAVDTRTLHDEFYEAHYHHPSDDLSQPIVWETAVRFTRAGARIGYRIAMDDQRPKWNEGDFFGDKFGK